MPDKNNDKGMDDTGSDERVKALLLAIHEEIDTLTPEELKRLYAAIALMNINSDE